MPRPLAQRLDDYAQGGGHLITTYFSGIVDENDHAWLGGYPGALREVLGIRVEEFRPLHHGETVSLGSVPGRGELWTEIVDIASENVSIVASFEQDEELGGLPAVTRRALKSGSASYVATCLDSEARSVVLQKLLNAAGIGSELPEALRGQVELAVRRGENSDFAFLINRTNTELSLEGFAGQVIGGPDAPGARGILDARAVAVFEIEHQN